MEAIRLAVARLVVVALLFGLAGCHHKSEKDFTPASENARAALDAALKSWQSGQPPGAVAGTSKPVVQVEDSEWRGGLKLKAFEVVKDEPPAGPGPRVFTVRLTTDDGKTREVSYMVVGIDPLLIYRDIDYDKLTGMSK